MLNNYRAIAFHVVKVLSLVLTVPGSQGHSLQISETNTSNVFVELLRGRDGIPGRDGMNGHDGLRGEAGPPGIKGERGSRGDSGLDGSFGPAGPAGSSGPRGIKGNNGDFGFRGESGLTGESGSPGPVGPPGARGPQGKEGPSGPLSGGATYTRWGKSSCPSVRGTEYVYSGIAGGSLFTQDGGGSNYLCLPNVPEYSTSLTYRAEVQQDHAPIHGAKYVDLVQGSSSGLIVPCTVCRVTTRPSVVMFPAMANCPRSWTREYYGYLMTERNVHKRTTFECVDRSFDPIPGNQANKTDGTLFFHTEATCSSGLPCPPYNNHQELNCVVCTK